MCFRAILGLAVLLGGAGPLLAQSTNERPVITMDPTGGSVKSGEAVTLNVIATGTPPLTYRWRLNGTNLPSATNLVYSLPSVDLRHYGNYQVVVSNAFGAVTSAVAQVKVDDDLTFRIVTLQTNATTASDITALINNNKGGLAVSSQSIFVNGRAEGADNQPQTGRIPLATLSGGSTLLPGYDALVSNLRTETVYSLGNGANPLRYIGGTLSSQQISSLLELDGATGQLTGRRINLSTNISVANSNARNIGLFAGYDRIVLHIGTRLYNIDLPAGRVIDMGTMSSPSHPSVSYGLGYWGIAEYWHGSLSLVHVQNYYTISRTRAPQRTVTQLLSLPTYDYYSTLPYINSIAFSLTRNRWYAHSEGPSIFNNTLDYGQEYVCSAKANYTLDPGFPEITREPANLVSYPSSNVTFTVQVTGTPPLFYQWYFDGAPLPNATNATLELPGIEPENEGNYSVQVRNDAGVATSRNAFLTVYSAAEFQGNPASRSVFVGSNVTFSTVFNAAPPYTLQWLFNGAALPGATNQTLAITNVQPQHAGRYSLAVQNRYATVPSLEAELNVVIPHDDGSIFKITELLTNSVRAVDAYDVLNNYPYGAMAASSTRILYSDAQATAHHSLADLSGGTRVSTGYGPVVGDLRSGQVYTLAYNGNPIEYYNSFPLNGLLEINGANGTLTGREIKLSQEIPLYSLSSQVGFFAGYGRLVVLTGSRAYQIALPSGVVKDLGPMSTPSHASNITGPGAFYGIAEHFGGSLFVVYAANNRNVMRTRVPDGSSTLLTNFFNLSSYMASMTVSLAQNRWYFMHWNNSQFTNGLTMTLGSAPMTYVLDSGMAVDHLAWNPIPPLQVRGVPFTATLRAMTSKGQVVTNYQGRVTLSALAGPSRTPLKITPTLVVNFTNGVWTGPVTVDQESPSLVLAAMDQDGNLGESDVILVSPPNDLVLLVTESADPVVLGAPLTYELAITNIGPAIARGVSVTNLIPPNSVLLKTTPSRGACVNEGQLVRCDFGDVNSGELLTVKVEVAAASLGTLTNRAGLIRTDADPMPANNLAVTLTSVILPSIYVSDASLPEGNSGTNYVSFTISLFPPFTNTVSARFSSGNDSAVSVGTYFDFVSTNGLLTFPPGVTNQIIQVAVRGDQLYETNETFFLNVFNPTNATILDGQGVCTIVDDDPMPYVTLSNAAVVEGDTGFANALFRVILSGPSGYAVQVNYSTTNGTATAGSDYNPRNASLSFAAGSLILTQNIIVQVVGDKVAELDEDFFLQINSVANAGLSNSLARCVITNNDGGGQLDHFVWPAIASPQSTSNPVAVTLTAYDVFGGLATNYQGTVNFSASMGVPQKQYTLLNYTTPTNYFQDAAYTLAFAFTPSTNIYVTGLRGYSGVRASLWTDDGTLLASANLPTTISNNLIDIPLETPVQLQAGTVYRVGFFSNTRFYVYENPPSDFDFGTIGASYYTQEDAFPEIFLGQGYIYLVDLIYSPGPPSVPMLITPTESGTFSNGVWSGQITFLQPGTNVLLRIEDTQPPHISSTSNPFDVLSVALADTDGDGMPDDWELAHNLDPGSASDATMDSDHDGLTNYQEYQAATDPRSATSVLRFSTLEHSGADIRLHFQGVPGRDYVLERAYNLGSSAWVEVRTFTAGSGPETVVLDSSASATCGFYRVRMK